MGQKKEKIGPKRAQKERGQPRREGSVKLLDADNGGAISFVGHSFGPEVENRPGAFFYSPVIGLYIHCESLSTAPPKVELSDSSMPYSRHLRQQASFRGGLRISAKAGTEGKQVKACGRRGARPPRSARRHVPRSGLTFRALFFGDPLVLAPDPRQAGDD